MKTYYFTLTGTKYFHGKEFIKEGIKVVLEKEPGNEYDKEAIKVTLKPIGCIGYVANSPYAVIGDECFSAGRLYDKIQDKAQATVLFKLEQGIICQIEVEDYYNKQKRVHKRKQINRKQSLKF